MKIKTLTKIQWQISGFDAGGDTRWRDIWINLNWIRQKEINSIEFKFLVKKLELSGKFRLESAHKWPHITSQTLEGDFK